MACEVGRCKFVRRAGAGGDVISGCNGGWFGFEEGLVTGDGDLGGSDVVSNVGDMMVVIFVGGSPVVNSSITAIIWA